MKPTEEISLSKARYIHLMTLVREDKPVSIAEILEEGFQTFCVNHLFSAVYNKNNILRKYYTIQ